MGGAMYCGMMPWGIIGGALIGAYGEGPHVAHGEGAYGAGWHVAASGAAYVGAGAQAGAQTGAGGAQTAPRLNQLHGQHGQSRAQQQPPAAGSIATASKISVFFMILL